MLGDDTGYAADLLTEGCHHGMGAEACRRAGDFGRAERMAGDALRIATSAPPVSFTMIAPVFFCAGVLIDSISRASDPAATASRTRLARRAVSALARYAQVFPIASPASLLRRGDMEAAAGRPAQARKHWTAALAKEERLGMNWCARSARSRLASA